MAILGNSKRFIRSPSAQKVIGELQRRCAEGWHAKVASHSAHRTEGIWSGRIVYHAVNPYAIIADVSSASFSVEAEHR